MIFEIVEIQYKVNMNGYIYIIFFKKDYGVVFRHKEDIIDLPTTNEVFTENGWKAITKPNPYPYYHFQTLQEIEEFIKSNK